MAVPATFWTSGGRSRVSGVTVAPKPALAWASRLTRPRVMEPSTPAEAENPLTSKPIPTNRSTPASAYGWATPVMLAICWKLPLPAPPSGVRLKLRFASRPYSAKASTCKSSGSGPMGKVASKMVCVSRAGSGPPCPSGGICWWIVAAWAELVELAPEIARDLVAVELDEPVDGRGGGLGGAVPGREAGRWIAHQILAEGGREPLLGTGGLERVVLLDQLHRVSVGLLGAVDDVGEAGHDVVAALGDGGVGRELERRREEVVLEDGELGGRVRHRAEIRMQDQRGVDDVDGALDRSAEVEADRGVERGVAVDVVAVHAEGERVRRHVEGHVGREREGDEGYSPTSPACQPAASGGG